MAYAVHVSQTWRLSTNYTTCVRLLAFMRTGEVDQKSHVHDCRPRYCPGLVNAHRVVVSKEKCLSTTVAMDFALSTYATGAARDCQVMSPIRRQPGARKQ